MTNKSRHSPSRKDPPPGHRKGLVDVTVRVPADRVEVVKNYVARISRRREPVACDVILDHLRHHRHVLERLGVRSLALFGSVARCEAKPNSDIDLMVDFQPDRTVSLFKFIEVKHVLEGLLGRPVDLVTAANIKPRLRDRILGECILVF